MSDTGPQQDGRDEPFVAPEVRIPIRPDLREARTELTQFFKEIEEQVKRIEEMMKKIGVNGQGIVGSPNQSPQERNNAQTQGNDLKTQVEELTKVIGSIVVNQAMAGNDIKEMRDNIEAIRVIAEQLQTE